MQYAIEAQDLVKTYGRITALDHVSIQVDEGEIFGFLGPNGAGKSTFVKIILNLIFPSRGSAKIFGQNVTNSSSRKSVGFLPENIRVYPFLTVEEFMRLHAELAEIPGKNIQNEVDRCLDMLGMVERKKSRIAALSKGMLQRVSIAQAILGRPRLLILDEPTSGLDPIGIKELRTILLEMKQIGTTILLNSHLLSEVEKTCDKVAILSNGKIIKSSTKSDLSGNRKHLEAVVEGFTDTMARQINELSSLPVEKTGNLITFYPQNENDSVAIHKIIIDQGAKLISLSWKGESLEEIFYKLVK